MKKLQKVCRGLILSALVAVLSPAVLAAGLLNLTVSETGIYRISYDELLVDHGVDLKNLRHRHFALTRIDEQTGDVVKVQLRTKGQTAGGPRRYFGPGGYIEFHAEYTPNLYSDVSTYTLHSDWSLRWRVKQVAPRLRIKPRATFATTYVHSQIVEKNGLYDYLSPSTTDPYHYGYIVGQGPAQGPVYNFNLVEVAASDASLEVELFGISDLNEEIDHAVSIVVNGATVGASQFGGSSVEIIDLPQAAVQEGENSLRIDLTGELGVPFDVVALNKFKVRYQRNSVAQNNYLHGELAAGHFKATGFSNNNILIYRFENGTLKMVGGRRSPRLNNGSSHIKFNAGQGGEYFIIAEGGFKKPGVEAIYDDANISSGDAEYLIITSSEFIGADLDAFVGLRSADYSVKVVDVTQIYGQFGIHQPTAKAIKEYIEFAASTLGTKYVLIVGGDSYDYKDIGNFGVVSHVPTSYVKTPSGSLPINHAPSDAVYGDLDNDGIPDIPVGRFPLRQASELANVVNKISIYEARQGYQGKVMVVAGQYDDGSSLDFKVDALASIEQMPALWKNSVTSAFKAFPDDDGSAAARTKLLNAINAGVEVTTYIGHSSQQQWSANPVIFKANDVANLTNTNLPTLVTQWGCWNTYFVRPTSNSMAEVLLLSEGKGAVAVLGASTLTTSTGEAKLGKELSARMYNPGVTIGDAVVAAKQAMAVNSPNAADILLGWQILGDPALVIQPE